MRPHRPGDLSLDPDDPALDTLSDDLARTGPPAPPVPADSPPPAPPPGPNPAADPRQEDTPVPPNVPLAVLGYTYMDATLEAWWGKWSRRGRTEDPLAAELERAVAAGREHQPSQGLAQWMRERAAAAHQEEPPEGPIPPVKARAWLQARRRELRGPGVAPGTGVAMDGRRPPVALAYRTGRALYKAQSRLSALEVEGATLTCPREIYDALWDHRKEIWESSPHFRPTAFPSLRPTSPRAPRRPTTLPRSRPARPWGPVS